MIPDCAVSIGTHHSVHGLCQDFARFGGTKDNAYVLVSDGCSSSKDSEIGSKLLTLAAEKFVQAELSDEEYHQQTIKSAQGYAKTLGLPESCLDATLLTIRQFKGAYFASIFGDGIIAQRVADTLHVYQVSYASGFPNYPSYLLNPNRAKQIDKEATVRTFDIIDSEKRNEEITTVRFGLPDIATCFCIPMHYGADFIALLTDGAASFLAPVESETSKATAAIELEQILPSLVAFRNFQPGYAKRRMQRVLKDVSGKGWQHFDDLSIGVLAHGEIK